MVEAIGGFDKFPRGKGWINGLNPSVTFQLFPPRFCIFFVSSDICCLIAERLIGSPFHKIFSRWFLPLDLCIAVCLASLSAASFPTEPI